MAASERTPLSPSPSPSLRPFPSSRRSSDYLLLHRVAGSPSSSPGAEIPLPRPRFWFLLPIFGAVDLICSIVFAASYHATDGWGKNELALLGWGLFRAIGVNWATSSLRIRETGWFIVGSALISALLALAELNLIIQNRWTFSPSGSSPASLALYCLSHVFFGLLHWLGFAAIVGVTRERNPYGLGLQSAAGRRTAWKEGVANVQFQETGVGGEGDNDKGQRREGWENSLRRQQRMNETSFESDGESDEDEDDVPIDALEANDDQDEDEDEEEDTADDSEDDPNDIIDIVPSPSSIRHRKISQSRSLRSRHSFYRRNSVHNDPEDGMVGGSPSPTSGNAMSNGYGTFRSLAGI